MAQRARRPGIQELLVRLELHRLVPSARALESGKRTLHLLSLAVAGTLHMMIQQVPWTSNALLAIERVTIVAFPASMSAAVSQCPETGALKGSGRDLSASCRARSTG
jgi:hypothetical protein